MRWRTATPVHARRIAAGVRSRDWGMRLRGGRLSLADRGRVRVSLRAGTNTAYFFGDSPAELKGYAWFKANSPRGSHFVGEKPANPWGLHDMLGNLWEWCHDYYQEDYYQQSPERDPRGRPPAKIAWSGVAAGIPSRAIAARPTAVAKCPSSRTAVLPKTSRARSASGACGGRSGSTPPASRLSGNSMRTTVPAPRELSMHRLPPATAPADGCLSGRTSWRLSDRVEADTPIAHDDLQAILQLGQFHTRPQGLAVAAMLLRLSWIIR